MRKETALDLNSASELSREGREDCTSVLNDEGGLALASRCVTDGVFFFVEHTQICGFRYETLNFGTP